jgi:alpha-N-arabinofuranosidase
MLYCKRLHQEIGQFASEKLALAPEDRYMKLPFVSLLPAVIFCGSIVSNGSGQTLPVPDAAGVTKININAANPAGYIIPRTIFGSFLEPIGNSTYGGLVSDVIANPSFEEGLWDAAHINKMLTDEPSLVRASELGLPFPWEPLDPTQNNRYEPRWRDAANSYRSIFVMGLPDKEVGVRQKVYLPVHRTLLYRGSVYAKYVSGSRELGISLRQRNRLERIFAHSTVQVTGTDWARYEFTLELPPRSVEPLEPVDFVLSVGQEGRMLLDQASLLPSDNIDGMDPEMIAMARAMKSPNIRFGGNFTSAYHWRDGIGPRDQRVSMKNVAWGIPEYNTFGTDEFLRFCELIGSRPQIALNLGSGTADENTAWLKYVNERWGDHSGGLLWEMGNELWGTFQVGYPTRQRVAERTKSFAQAVHLVDPKAVLIGTGADEDFYRDWNAAQLAVADSIQYLSTHFVVTGNAVLKKDPSEDFIAQANFALPVGLESKLREMYAQIQSVPAARDRVKIAFTEWLFGGESEKGPRYDNMGGAIETAGFLNMLMRVADFVPLSNMTGTIYFGGIWKERGRVFGVPAYWAFRMYSNADVTRPIEVVTNSEIYNVEQGSIRLPKISNVPYLDAVAALNESGDTLTLFCVNRHLTRDIPASITISGFTPTAEALVQTLYARSLFEKNDEIRPEAVTPHESTASVSGSQLNFTFRHESVTVLTLRRTTSVSASLRAPR